MSTLVTFCGWVYVSGLILAQLMAVSVCHVYTYEQNKEAPLSSFYDNLLGHMGMALLSWIYVGFSCYLIYDAIENAKCIKEYRLRREKEETEKQIKYYQEYKESLKDLEKEVATPIAE